MKPKIYVQGAWNTDLYMNASIHDAFGPAFEFVIRPDLPAPAGLKETVARLKGCIGILSLNGADDLKELTADVLRAAGGVRVAAVVHWWHHCHEPMTAQWRAAGAAVLDASDGNNQATAEWAVAACLLAARRMIELDRAVRNGDWPECRYPSDLLCETTVGVLGLGRVGRIVARKLVALDARVLGWDPLLTPDEIRATGAEPVKDLADVMRGSGVVTMHLPISDETKGLVSARHLATMRDGTAFVNAGRAWTVDGAALFRELSSGRLRGFLDVFATEPLPADDPLRDLPNVLVSPHVAGNTLAMYGRCARTGLKALQEWLIAHPA